MLPEHRLAVLLDQVKRTQITDCLFHNTAASPSLYQDHTCDREDFPTQTILELDHKFEVWQAKFSHDGSRLAVCGNDGDAIIYETESFEPLKNLACSRSAIGSLAWSPDDTMIVACSRDKSARLWKLTVCPTSLLSYTPVNVVQKNEVYPLGPFGEPVSSCTWAPDGQSFVIGCLDKERNLQQWDINGHLMYDWGRSHRIQDLAVSPDGNRLVAMDNADHIHVYNFVTRELEYELDLKVNLCSVSISQDSKYLLINNADGEARLMDLDTRGTTRKYVTGEKAVKFIIRSAFGGANESFVICGSEGTLRSSTIPASC